MLQRMEAVRYTKTDYNLSSMEELVALHVESVMANLSPFPNAAHKNEA